MFERVTIFSYCLFDTSACTFSAAQPPPTPAANERGERTKIMAQNRILSTTRWVMVSQLILNFVPNFSLFKILFYADVVAYLFCEDDKSDGVDYANIQ